MRLVAALAVVLLTYNPCGHSFYHWAMKDFASITRVRAFAGALLLPEELSLGTPILYVVTEAAILITWAAQSKPVKNRLTNGVQVRRFHLL